ncbi:thiopeptide-type bacteriocin biosynthesis protein [Streptomyces sp. NPDC059957]|uniref:thiopeptide-type bacteriocin biosynthesis protein n=1 Tax=unclassified Streptomyces TaxID=2593676 RepID=UPI00365D3008
MTLHPWRQANVAFPDWDHAEATALKHLVPLLHHAQAEGAVTPWFHVRKSPCWRVRYQPGPSGHSHISTGLDVLTTRGHITGWTEVIYEPEVHAFGGGAAMDAAHRLFHADSHHLTTQLRADGGRHRRETSLLLCTLLMRSAGLDWYEQGDVWARVGEHRGPPAATNAGHGPKLLHAVSRLISVDTEEMLRSEGALAHLARWAHAYSDTGTALAHLNSAGQLHRGLRDVLAHHVIFAWNRIGLSQPAQAELATAARTVIFGPDPTTDGRPENRVETA